MTRSSPTVRMTVARSAEMGSDLAVFWRSGTSVGGAPKAQVGAVVSMRSSARAATRRALRGTRVGFHDYPIGSPVVTPR